MSTHASNAARAQHAFLGIEQEKSNYQRTTHPDAQWFGSAGLGLFIHWGISTVHGGIDLSWGMIANLGWGPGTVITPESPWSVVAFAADGSPLAVSTGRPVSP